MEWSDIATIAPSIVALIVAILALKYSVKAYERDLSLKTDEADIQLGRGGDSKASIGQQGSMWGLSVRAKVKVANRGARNAILHDFIDVDIEINGYKPRGKIDVGRVTYLNSTIYEKLYEVQGQQHLDFPPWYVRVYTYELKVPFDQSSDPPEYEGFEDAVRRLCQDHCITATFNAEYYSAADKPEDDHRKCEPCKITIPLESDWKGKITNQLRDVGPDSEYWPVKELLK